MVFSYNNIIIQNRMSQTEQYLVGKNVGDITALQGALKILSQVN